MRGGHRQRVACIGPPQTAGRRRVHDFGATHHAGQRHSACQAFRHRHQVGLVGVVFHGKQFPRTGEAALYFVGNHHDPVFITDTADGGHQFWRGDVESAFTLNGFKNNRRYLFRLNVCFEQTFYRRDGILRRDAVQLRGIGHVINRPREGAKSQLIRRDLAG